MKTYRIVATRDVTQTATLTIEAEDAEDALEQAEIESFSLSDSDWEVSTEGDPKFDEPEPEEETEKTSAED
jgi:hypothetical protein